MEHERELKLVFDFSEEEKSAIRHAEEPVLEAQAIRRQKLTEFRKEVFRPAIGEECLFVVADEAKQLIFARDVETVAVGELGTNSAKVYDGVVRFRIAGNRVCIRADSIYQAYDTIIGYFFKAWRRLFKPDEIRLIEGQQGLYMALAYASCVVVFESGVIEIVFRLPDEEAEALVPVIIPGGYAFISESELPRALQHGAVLSDGYGEPIAYPETKAA